MVMLALIKLPGLCCTNISASSNVVLNFIFEQVSVVSEQKNKKTDPLSLY